MRTGISFLAALALLLCLPYGAMAEDRIASCEVEVRLNADGSIRVKETITLQVEGVGYRSGFDRYFPLAYSVGGERIPAPVRVASVQRQGRPVPYTVDTFGNFSRLRIGPQERTVGNRLKPGAHTYVIQWTGQDHVRAFPWKNELYLETVGVESWLSVEKGAVRVFLPEGVLAGKSAGYIVSRGDRKQRTDMGLRGGRLEASLPRPLDRDESFAVGIALTGREIPAVPVNPDNAVLQELQDCTRYVMPLKGILLLLTTLPALLWYAAAWAIWGRDRPLGAIVPIYSAPEGVSPAMASTLLRVQPRTAFVASLLSLMAKGCLSLREGYLVAEKKEPEEPLPGEEQAIIDSIGKGRMIANYGDDRGMYRTYSAFTRKCSSLYRKYVDQNRKLVAVGVLLQIAAILALMEELLSLLPALLLPAVYIPFLYLARKYTPRGTKGVLTVLFLVVHFFIMGLAVLAAFEGVSSLAGMLAIEVAVLAVIGLHWLFFILLDKPGAAAVKLLAKIEGLRLFMATADANRYALMPPDLYEKNLPYAVIFGLEHSWLEEFSSLEGVLPWHPGGGGTRPSESMVRELSAGVDKALPLEKPSPKPSERRKKSSRKGGARTIRRG